MSTGRSLTVWWSLPASRGGVCSQGVSAARGGVCSWGCLLKGGLFPGGCLLWGGVCSGGCLFRGVCLLPGVYALGGCLLSRGVCSRGVWYISMQRQTTPPPPWTESQTPVKTLPWPNFVAAGNKDKEITVFSVCKQYNKSYNSLLAAIYRHEMLEKKVKLTRIVEVLWWDSETVFLPNLPVAWHRGGQF